MCACLNGLCGCPRACREVSLVAIEKRGACRMQDRSCDHGRESDSHALGKGRGLAIRPAHPCAFLPRTRVLRLAALACAFALAFAGVGLAGCSQSGSGAQESPEAQAAACYGDGKYLQESDVTDYILTYKQQMGLGSASDDEWASFLANYNLTPERLRLTTITQMLADRAVEDRCNQLGIAVLAEEIDASIDALKSMYTMGDDDIWQSTLSMYGQDEEGLRETYRLQLLKQKLWKQEVERPEPTERQVRDYIADFAQRRLARMAEQAVSSEEALRVEQDNPTVPVRHSFKFDISANGAEVGLAQSDAVEQARSQFASGDQTSAAFADLLRRHSNDAALVEAGGEMGWDADTTSYTENYLRVLGTLAQGSISPVFTDGDAACFIWVDQIADIPTSQEAIAALDLASLPESLYQYFCDGAASNAWQEQGSAYLQRLAAIEDATIYPMPEDAPYNVDMSAYRVEGADASSSG